MKLRWIVSAGILIAWWVSGSTLRPSVFVYGEIRDAYGIRMESGAVVSLLSSGREIARTEVGPWPAGMNYKLAMDVADPLTAQPDEIKPGDSVRVRVQVGAISQPLIGNRVFSVPGDGAPVRADFVIGEDSDGDGLPDAWENMVIANSSGAAQELDDVGPGMDLDGDGMDDDEEFWYGSFAFLPGDELSFRMFSRAQDRFVVTLLTIPGVTYVIERSFSLTQPYWIRCPVALAETDPVALPTFEGDGGFVDVYFEPVRRPARYRLRTL